MIVADRYDFRRPTRLKSLDRQRGRRLGSELPRPVGIALHCQPFSVITHVSLAGAHTADRHYAHSVRKSASDVGKAAAVSIRRVTYGQQYIKCIENTLIGLRAKLM